MDGEDNVRWGGTFPTPWDKMPALLERIGQLNEDEAQRTKHAEMKAAMDAKRAKMQNAPFWLRGGMP